MAVSFWSFSGDFDLAWWFSNTLLMIVPIIVFGVLVSHGDAQGFGKVVK